ncbi:MAG TPA: hypothetical protein VNI54_08830 [Thermoanaerobaculia bacterium]|nr:hypothetical protein [Thermoanaerobaculia bacterium]
MALGWGEMARLRAQHPNEPWLWRSDWTARTVRQSADLGGWCLFGFAVIWNLFCIPVWFLAPWRGPWDAKAILLASFPISGVLLLLLAVYATLRRRKYGVSVCRIEHSPIPLGTTFRGELEVRLHESPPAGFALRLASLRRTVSGSGKNRSTHEVVLWQDEQTITHGVMPSPNGVRLPFRFELPIDAEPCDFSNPNRVTLWRLDVSADVPGIDYEASFELPVFGRSESTESSSYVTPHSPSSWHPPREISVSGETIVVRSGARAGDWIGYVMFFALWYGALFLFRKLGAPLWVPLAFGAFGGLFVLFAIDFLLGRTTITANRRALTVRRRWLGIGFSSRTFALPDLVRIEHHIGVTAGSRAYHNVRAVLRDGRTRTVARHLRNRRDAEMLAARVGEMIGL